MKENNNKECVAVLVMLLLVFFGYSMFYNKAFSGYEAQGTHIWLSASTVKFVNNWLEEGPLKLNFIMYEYPDSFEFNGTDERKAYISYPPGAIIPPYILAKVLHKSEIQVGFIKQFLKMKFLLDTLLVSLIIYSVFRVTLCLPRSNTAIITSIVFSLLWMCLPINLYYLRNIYFSDQCIITVVFLFILLEIYDEYFSKKHLLKHFYIGLKFIVSLYGVLTDWYFLFVLFVSWLVKVALLIKSKDKLIKIVLASLVYILPVFFGIGLFYIQIIHIPDYNDIILYKMTSRMSGKVDGIENNIGGIINNFTANYPMGWLLVSLLVISLFVVIKKYKSFPKKYRSLTVIMTIIYVPPVLQVLVFQNHSAIHEFSMLKFALPMIFSIVILTVCILELIRLPDANIVIQIENDLRNIKVRLLYLIIIVFSVLYSGMLNMNIYYFQSRINVPVSYERENLVRSNHSFSDVYFSFTESIAANPPQYLAVSKKLIYKIDSVPEIFEKFTNLNPDARILLMVNKEDFDKSQQTIENEQDALKIAKILFSSKNYDVYEIDRDFWMENANTPVTP
jgi:hypothetical protein